MPPVINMLLNHFQLKNTNIPLNLCHARMAGLVTWESASIFLKIQEPGQQARTSVPLIQPLLLSSTPQKNW